MNEKPSKKQVFLDKCKREVDNIVVDRDTLRQVQNQPDPVNEIGADYRSVRDDSLPENLVRLRKRSPTDTRNDSVSGGLSGLSRTVDVPPPEDLITPSRSPSSAALPAQQTPSLENMVGSHRVIKELGRGGMGVVFLAYQEELGRYDVLKQLLNLGSVSDADLKRFVREGRAMAKLNHQGIVHVRSLKSHEGMPYIVMEYVPGEDLKEYSRTHSFDNKSATVMIKKIAEAVHYAHEQGVIHRDLKPANVLLDTNGEPKITDFGLAKIEDMRQSLERLTQTGEILGTPIYMAPEQALSNKISEQADIYALGAMFYELLTGHIPIKPKSSALATLAAITNEKPVPPSQLDPTVDPRLDKIVMKCLKKDPGDRYMTAAGIIEDLKQYLKGDAPVKRSKLGYVGGLAAIALAVFGVVGDYLLSTTPDIPTEDPVVRNNDHLVDKIDTAVVTSKVNPKPDEDISDKVLPPPNEPHSVEYAGPLYNILNAEGKEIGRGSVNFGPNEPRPSGISNNFNVKHYLIGDVDGDGEKEIVFIANPTKGPVAQVAIANASGEIKARYLNVGFLYSLVLHDTNGDGIKDIVGGGTNNAIGEDNNNPPIMFCLYGKAIMQRKIAIAPPHNELPVAKFYTVVKYERDDDKKLISDSVVKLTVVGDTLIGTGERGDQYRVNLLNGELLD